MYDLGYGVSLNLSFLICANPTGYLMVQEYGSTASVFYKRTFLNYEKLTSRNIYYLWDNALFHLIFVITLLPKLCPGLREIDTY